MALSGPALWLLALAVIAMAAAYWLFRRSAAGRARSGIPRGEVVYADTAGWAPAETLYSERFRLAGKPDYVVRVADALVPVEVKPGRRAEEPYEGDVLQLAAYCLLLAETHGSRPAYGLLRYERRTFRIPFDAGLEQALLSVLQAMRADLRMTDVPRSHDDPVRCRSCGLREDCTQELVD
jgi:CRISPR-associated exonuclease Cas4